MKSNEILFPVKVPYATAPDIVKLKDAFHLTPINDDHLLFKKAQLEIFGNDLSAQIDDHQLEKCFLKISEIFKLPAISKINDLAFLVKEDIAVLSSGKVIAICFCSPSGFIPSALLGKSFYEIHQPVPDAELLLKMSDKLSNVLSAINRGPHRRYVWTITSNPSNNQHPHLKDKFIPELIDDLYFRTEIQTTIPLGDNVHALFSVNVNMTPLTELWSDYEKRNTIIESVNSMSEAMLDYKNLKLIKTILLKNQ